MGRTDVNNSSITKGAYQIRTENHNYIQSNGVVALGSVSENSSLGFSNYESVFRSSIRTSTGPFRKVLKLSPNPFSFKKTERKYYFETTKLISTPAAGPQLSEVTRVGYSLPTQPAPTDWSLPQLVTIPQSDIDNLDRILRTELLLKVKDQKVNLEQALAEREQTISLIAGTAKNLANAIFAIRKGRINEALNYVGVYVGKRSRRKWNRSWQRDQAKAAANAWIQVQYGVRPLLDDIRGSAESFFRLLEEAQTVRQVEVHKKLRVNDLRSYITQQGFARSTVQVLHSEYDIKYGCYFRPDIGVSGLPTSLGLTNPASILWEVTPWSFVVDWFLPIGNWISSWDATVGWSFISGYRTTFSRRTGQLQTTAAGVPNGTTQTVVYHLGNSFVTEVSCDRTLLGSFPIPGTPVFKNPFSTTHMFNALALLIQQASKGL